MGMELEVDTPRLSTPFYEALKKKYPKAFRRKSVSSQASDTTSLCSDSNYGSIQCLSVDISQSTKFPKQQHKGLPPLPPGQSQRFDFENSTERNLQRKNLQLKDCTQISQDNVANIISFEGVLDSNTLSTIKKSKKQYSSLSSVCSEPDRLSWKGGNLKKASYYFSSTLSLRETSKQILDKLQNTDSSQFLKERLKQNQESWKTLLSQDNSPFNMCRSLHNSIKNLQSKQDKNGKLSVNIALKECDQFQCSFDKYSNKRKTLQALTEIQSKITAQSELAKEKYWRTVYQTPADRATVSSNQLLTGIYTNNKTNKNNSFKSECTNLFGVEHVTRQTVTSADNTVMRGTRKDQICTEEETKNDTKLCLSDDEQDSLTGKCLLQSVDDWGHCDESVSESKKVFKSSPVFKASTKLHKLKSRQQLTNKKEKSTDCDSA